MTIEQTIDIPPSRRVHLDFDLPFPFPVGRAKITVTPDEKQTADESQKTVDLSGPLKRPGTEEILAEAEKIWTWNRSHPEEVKEALRNLREGGPLFGGVDGVEFQRQIRDQRETDRAKISL